MWVTLLFCKYVGHTNSNIGVLWFMATIAAAVAAFTCDKNYELYSFSFLVASRVKPPVQRTEGGDIVVTPVSLLIIRL